MKNIAQAKTELSEEEFRDIFLQHKQVSNKNPSLIEVVLEYEKILKEITSAQEAFVILLDAPDKSLNIITKDIEIPITDYSDIEGILFKCLYSKEPHIIANARRNFLYRKKIDSFIDSKINDILVVPIFEDDNKKDIFGIIWIASTDENKEPFTQKDIDYINRFSVVIYTKILDYNNKLKSIKIAEEAKEEELKKEEAKKELSKKILLENELIEDELPEPKLLEHEPYKDELPIETKVLNLLIIDDSIIILKYLSAILKKYNINIITAQSGLEAIERFRHEDIDFIFMDQIMVGMLGHEVINRIREIEKKDKLKPVPIVALTSDTVKETKNVLLGNGANLVLHKPIRAEDIVKAIERFSTIKI